MARFASKDKFASYNGTAPIDVSSGDQVRHRLSRAGNRRINHALQMMAVTQIRYPGTAGRRYYERKRTEGKTPKEALRCLKRRLSDQVCRQPVRDRRGRIEACGSPTTPRPMRPASTSPASRSPQAAPPSRPPPRPASRGSSSSTGRTTASAGHRDPRRQHPPPPRPPRACGNPQLTRPPAAPDPAPVRRSCPGCQSAASVKAGPQAPARRACLDAGEHWHTLAKQANRGPADGMA